MADSLFKKVYTLDNLILAFKRLQTMQSNNNYKNYYRDSFFTYDLQRDENLSVLSKRLKNGSYEPSEPLRIFVPKSSGLQRTLSILQIDDLIVYQALVNILVPKFRRGRKSIEKTSVFSNIVNPGESIFFFEKWQEGYAGYNNKIKEYYRKGNKWVAHFDLAAFYDTINQETIKELISPNAEETFKDQLADCLKKWSSSARSRNMTQGIPQGPISSNYLCEIYLLDIDKALKKQNIKYVRYVDDIKILGVSKNDVLKGVILLERLCKERGLIPQGKKYDVIEAKNYQDALGKAPSLSIADRKKIPGSQEEAASVFLTAFRNKPMDVSTVKWILKVVDRNPKIKRTVLGNIERHPELVDSFIVFLEKYRYDSSVGDYLWKRTIVNSSAYEYVEGQFWTLLSKFNFINVKKSSIRLHAINRLKKSRNESSVRIGIYNMLSAIDAKTLTRYLSREGESIIQGIIASLIPSNIFDSTEYHNLLVSFRERSNYQPTLNCISQLLLYARFDLLNNYPKSKKHDDSGTINILLGSKVDIDTIGQILKNRYGVEYSNNWVKLLESDYEKANEQLVWAKKLEYIDRNAWMGYLNAFNDIIFRCIISNGKLINPKLSWPQLVGKNGLLDFGTLLFNAKQKNILISITGKFILFNTRRSKVPTSHAKDKRTGKGTIPLGYREKNKFKKSMEEAYVDIVKIINKFP